MSRREIRERIFQVLFCMEFYPKEELKEQLCWQAEDGDASEEDTVYIQDKINAVADRVKEIDDMINAVTKGWKTARMGKTDLALLRLAVYEIKFDEDIPTGVAINEAVELAKKYGTEDSPSFINGILAKIA